MMKDGRVRKEGGRSWIEAQGQVHVFLAGDRRHEMTEEIYAKLAELLRRSGSWVMYRIGRRCCTKWERERNVNR